MARRHPSELDQPHGPQVMEGINRSLPGRYLPADNVYCVAGWSKPPVDLYTALWWLWSDIACQGLVGIAASAGAIIFGVARLAPGTPFVATWEPSR